MVNATFVAFTIFTPYEFLGFHILRHIFKEQICANPFFRFSEGEKRRPEIRLRASQARQRAVLCSVRVSSQPRPQAIV